MVDSSTYWQSVVEVLRGRGLRFRIKWCQDETMTKWQPWVISPSPGYLETGSLGPVPVREVQWLDISHLDRDGNDISPEVVAALSGIDATFSRTEDSIQVLPVDVG